MNITFDPAKRERVLRERGLDFNDAPAVIGDWRSHTFRPTGEHGEPRVRTVGFLGDRMVMVIWTPRGDAVRIITMRRIHGREAKRYAPFLG